MFLEISQDSQENTCARVSFLIKLQTKACNFIKKGTLAQMFSCELCEISKSTFFTEHPWTTASGWIVKKVWNSLVLNLLWKNSLPRKLLTLIRLYKVTGNFEIQMLVFIGVLVVHVEIYQLFPIRMEMIYCRFAL